MVDSSVSGDMKARGRIGGLMLRATHDPAEYTQPARAAFLKTFYDATPSDLPESERLARAEAGLRAHMSRLARRSAIARRRRTANGGRK